MAAGAQAHRNVPKRLFPSAFSPRVTTVVDERDFHRVKSHLRRISLTLIPDCKNIWPLSGRSAPEIQKAQEETREYDLHTRRDGGGSWNDQAQSLRRWERAECGRSPDQDGMDEHRQAYATDQNPRPDSAFQSENELEQTKPAARGNKSLRYGEDASEQGEADQLQPQQNSQAADHERIRFHAEDSDLEWADRDPGLQSDAAKEQSRPRHTEQPRRAVQQHETQVTPTVAPTAQMRLAGTPIFVQGDRDLGHAHFLKGRFHHHLGGELHSGARQVHFQKRLLAQRAQPAMEIVRRAFEKQAAQERQHRIADPAMFPRHRAFHDAPLASRHPAAHHQFVALLQFLDERRDASEIVTIIRIPDDDPSAERRAHAAAQRRAVTSLANIDNSRSGAARDFLGAIATSVVGDHQLARDRQFGQSIPSLSDTGAKSLRLI